MYMSRNVSFLLACSNFKVQQKVTSDVLHRWFELYKANKCIAFELCDDILHHLT